MSCPEEIQKIFNSPEWKEKLETCTVAFNTYYNSFTQVMEDLVYDHKVYDPVALSLELMDGEEMVYPVLKKYKAVALVALWVPMMNLWHRVYHIEKRVVVAENPWLTKEQVAHFCEINWKALEEIQTNTGVTDPVQMAMVFAHLCTVEMHIKEGVAVGVITRHLVYPLCRLFLKLKEIQKNNNPKKEA